MSIFEYILLFVGIILLFLALISGVSLFKKAIKDTENEENNRNFGTLWLLFLIGIVVGLSLIWLALSSTGISMWIITLIGIIASIFGIMTLFGWIDALWYYLDSILNHTINFIQEEKLNKIGVKIPTVNE